MGSLGTDVKEIHKQQERVYEQRNRAEQQLQFQKEQEERYKERRVPEEEDRRNRAEQQLEFQRELEQRNEEKQRRDEEERRRQPELLRVLQEQHQRQLVDVLADVRDHRRRPNEAHFKITPFQEDKDIQDFLEAFEGIMRIQQVEEGQWVLRLTPLLRGKVRAVCTDIEDPEDYKKVKEAILDHYSVTPERCRKRFRAHR